MRMRLRANLPERLLACKDRLIQTKDEGKNVKDVLKESALLDYNKIFHNNAKVFLEIGCGQGSFLCKIAKENPQYNFIGMEKIANVIITGTEKAISENISNIVFLRGKAECLPKYIPENSISGIYLNFSTPLPKKGYEKQRLTAPRFLELYQNLLVENGFIKQKTDDRDFYLYSLEKFQENNFFIEDKTEDLHKNGEVGIITEYERKYISQNKQIYAITARKIDGKFFEKI